MGKMEGFGRGEGPDTVAQVLGTRKLGVSPYKFHVPMTHGPKVCSVRIPRHKNTFL